MYEIERLIMWDMIAMSVFISYSRRRGTMVYQELPELLFSGVPSLWRHEHPPHPLPLTPSVNKHDSLEECQSDQTTESRPTHPHHDMTWYDINLQESQESLSLLIALILVCLMMVGLYRGNRRGMRYISISSTTAICRM